MEEDKNVAQWAQDLTRMDLFTKIQLVGKDVEYIKEAIRRLEESNKLERDTYVTRDEFTPVKSIVYGIVALILTGVVGAILTLVIIK